MAKRLSHKVFRSIPAVQSTIPSNPVAALDEADAARYLGVSRSYLRRRRMEGYREKVTPGPPYCRIGGAIRYLLADLDAWLTAHRVDQTGEGA
ncbi:MAG: helix-turn-helix domain-containing protein [Gammaproteobacteria bacterium]